MTLFLQCRQIRPSVCFWHLMSHAFTLSYRYQQARILGPITNELWFMHCRLVPLSTVAFCLSVQFFFYTEKVAANRVNLTKQNAHSGPNLGDEGNWAMVTHGGPGVFLWCRELGSFNWLWSASFSPFCTCQVELMFMKWKLISGEIRKHGNMMTAIASVSWPVSLLTVHTSAKSHWLLGSIENERINGLLTALLTLLNSK